jgi:hypothetical protein
MSIPETPSTSAWCDLPTIANRRSSIPSTSHSSQSGFERSSRWEKIRAASVRRGLRAGGGERGVADVIGEVEVWVVDPNGATLREGNESELLAKARDEMQAGLDVVPELVVAGRGPLEQGDGGDVHVGRPPLEVEERRVEPGEAIGAHVAL